MRRMKIKHLLYVSIAVAGAFVIYQYAGKTKGTDSTDPGLLKKALGKLGLANVKEFADSTGAKVSVEYSTQKYRDSLVPKTSAGVLIANEVLDDPEKWTEKDG